MKRAACAFSLLLLMASCRQQEPRQSTIFGSSSETEADVYDLPQIRDAGVLIGVTLSGPDTYYEYRGEGFGLQYRLAQEFASSIGATLRMEIAPDTTALRQRLDSQQVDFICLPPDSLHPWPTRPNTPLLTQAIAEWWDPSRADRLRRQDRQRPAPRRHSRPPMQDRSRGIISPYDDLFVRHSATVGWDWRLLAAQCYQESGFDPQAQSWAGAQGLMQLMPATARQLGVAPDQIFDPSTNLAAAVRLLRMLNQQFADITDRAERTSFVLASYNGGYNHVRDAMALAEKHGANPRSWQQVAPYILKLADPAYYNDPVVRSGYLRGSETEAYVRLTLQRWHDYRGSARPASAASQPAPARRSIRNGEYQSQVKKPEESL